MTTIKILPAVVNNEQIQQLPKQLLDVSNAYLEDLKDTISNQN